MTESEKSYSAARATAELARRHLIDATYELPDDAPADVIRRWTVADGALLEFLRALVEAEESTNVVV